MTTKIAVVADTHVGHISGLMPRNFITDDGIEIPLTAAQQKMYENWKDFVDKVPKNSIVIFNGDTIQGVQMPWVTELMLPNYDDQVDAAELLFKPLVKKAKEVYVIAGTDFHSPMFHDNEKALSKTLKANWLGKYLNLKVEGKVINFCHRGAGGYVFRSTPLEREIQAALLAYAEGKIPKPDCFVRSHVHQCARTTVRGVLAIRTPCWQTTTDYVAEKGRYYQWMPDLGGTILTVDKIIDSEFITYPLPEETMNIEEIDEIKLKVRNQRKEIVNKYLRRN